MTNKFRPGTKRHTIVEVMNANADKPIDEVLALIVEATGCELRLAKHDYLWMSREGVAKGNPPPRATKAKTKVQKHIVQKARESVNKTIGKTFTVNSEYMQKVRAAHKIADPEIKAKNLAALRAAGEARIAKVKAKVIDVYDQSYEAELIEDIDRREEERNIFRANVHPSLHKELGLV